MNEDKLIPKRRFKEFINDEAWEQRKVKDIFKVTRGYVLAATKTTKEKTPSAPYPVYSSQTSNQGLMGYYKEYLYKNAITWTTDGANAGTVNYREGKFYCTNVCGVLISEEGYANKMISEALNKVAWKHVSKVGNPKLMNNVMSEIAISIPKNMKEQSAISNFFSNLDNLITLHQRKLEKLKNIKLAYLSEMFPKEGEKYPKRRFDGFTDPWEQRKLEDLGKTFAGLSGKTKKDFGHGDAEFVTYMNVFSNPISNADQTENVEIDERQNEVKYGDIFFTTSSETPEEVGMSSVWLASKPNVYLNSFCFGYRPTEKLDPYYMAFMLRSAEVRRKFQFLAQGISRYNISKTKVMDLSVSIPKLEEQAVIGQFFSSLDNLITLHQRKLEKLENIKKAYLNEMFV